MSTNFQLVRVEAVNAGSINDGSGAVYALRANDGTVRWYHTMYWVVYDPPVLIGSTIYVSTGRGRCVCFPGWQRLSDVAFPY